MLVTGAIDFKGDHVKGSLSKQYNQKGSEQSQSKYGSITGIIVETAD